MKHLLFLLVAALMLFSGSRAPARSETDAVRSDPIASQQILVLLRQRPPHFRGSDGYGTGYADARSMASRTSIGQQLAREHNLRFVGVWPMPEIKLDCISLETHAGQSIGDAIAAIERNKDVAWAEAVEVYQSLGSAGYNDPLFAVAPAATQWHLVEMHKMVTGKGVTVGVVDTGIDGAHPDLAGQMVRNRNFVAHRPLGAETHGTAVAGIIAAKANNRRGMVGIAPQSRLVGLRACWQQLRGSVCDSLSLAKALHYAVAADLDILNMSLTGPPSKLLGQLIDKAIAGGTIVVAAVETGASGGRFPAFHRGVVAVADKATIPVVADIYLAPGASVPTTQPDARWDVVSGSSYSAAHVSGLFALLIERHGRRKLRPELVRVNDGNGAINVRASLAKTAGR